MGGGDGVNKSRVCTVITASLFPLNGPLSPETIPPWLETFHSRPTFLGVPLAEHSGRIFKGIVSQDEKFFKGL